MYKVFIICFLLIFSSVANARVESEIESVVDKNTVTWKHYVVSDLIMPGGKDITEESVSYVNNVFNGKRINIDRVNVNIPGTCKYEYYMESITPLKYWHSQKTVDLYVKLLSKYNVTLNGDVILITPTRPSNKCGYPFSYFIKVDESLVFVLNNRMVIYSQNENGEKSDDIENHDDVDSQMMDEYGSVSESFYHGDTLLDAYGKYRDGLTTDYKNHLVEKILLNKDFTMKCENGCIEVDYNWSGPDKLIIKLMFEGGETEIDFLKEAQGTKVLTKSSPD